MIAFIVIGLLIGWLMAAKWLADKAIQYMKIGKSRFLAWELLTVLIFIAPVSDEIVGRFQLSALCEKNAAIQTDSQKIEGKTVRALIDPSRQEVPGTLIKIYYTYVSYRDINSNEELAGYGRYEADGGILRRLLHPLAGVPVSLDSSACSNAASIKYDFIRSN